jgi:hypothetical protein
MKLPNIIPPTDLLNQIEGIEGGLRQRKRLGIIGLVAAVLQVLVLVINDDWWQELVAYDWVTLGKDYWVSLLILTGVIFSLLVASWAKFWLKESQGSFRYTCSISDFVPVRETENEENMSVLSHHLAERLSKRIGRLSFLDEEHVKADDGRKGKSHIHIRGYYIVRERSDDNRVIEVMPRVRIGPSGSPETLAHPVSFNLTQAESNTQTPAVEIKESDTQAKKTPVGALGVTEYEQVLERIYFSVATEIYKQIQHDVKQKIELLPTDYFRAVALFHEAEDYATSNTLDAYDEALKLYDEAIKLFDPCSRPLWQSRCRRWLQRALRWRASFWRELKRRGAYIWPRLTSTEVMCARAEIGYANMLLYRGILAQLSGHRVNSVFEARPVAGRAAERLEKLPKDTPKRRETLFDAHVTLALALQFLMSYRNAEKCLEKARQLDPFRAEKDARFIFVTGSLEVKPRSTLQLFRHAVELEPRFEIAQFSLASQFEMLWRTRRTLERNVAEMVFNEYKEVLKINPGNIGAWANLGYMHWLLDDIGDIKDAEEAFESGREYKEIKRETFVAELDYGLARIAAERGKFEEAYKHYISAVSAHIAQGVLYSSGGYTAQFYYFDFIGDAILKRFDKYKNEVEKHLSCWEGKDVSEPTKRIRDSVYAFVLNDYGQACYRYYLRSGNEGFLSKARSAYEDTIGLNDDYVIPYYNLYELNPREGLEYIEKVGELEPKWIDGKLAMLQKAEEEPLKTLLPHEWFWVYDKNRDNRHFNWKALDRRDFEEELKWEKECGDVHVRILLTWGMALAKEDQPKAEKLFGHLHKHFWQDDLDLLISWRGSSSNEDKVKVLNKSIRAIIKLWLVYDPTNYTNLGWVKNEEAFEKEDKKRIFSEALRKPDLSDSLYKCLGDWLLEIGEENEAFDAYHRAITADDLAVRQAAVSALGQIGDTRAVEPLLARLEDQESGVRQAAASALGQIGDTRAVEPWRARLEDQESGVRQAAASALGQIGDTRAVEPLLARLEDQDSWARQAAASALGQIGDTRARGALIGRLSADNPNTRAEALEALSLTCKDQTDRKLLSQDLDAMTPFLDLHQEIDEMRVRQASEKLEVPVQEVCCRYEALAQQFPLKLAWQAKKTVPS